jgi:hypothetical protein
MSSRLRPLRDGHGRVARWCNLLTDIDDRKRAEDSVRASERDLRLILDSIPCFIHTLTPAGEVEHVNQRILDFFGLSAEELRDWTRVTHPDDIARVGEILEHSLRTGTLFECESRARRADGVYRWLHARGMPLRNADGKIVRWYHVLTDVDDRKRAEEASRSSESNLRLMVDSIPGFICTNTASGEVDYVNRTLLEYTGKPLEELRNWPVVVHPDDLPTVAEFWTHSITTGEPFNVEVRVRRGDGVYRWFHCRGLPLRDDDGRILRWYNLLTDIDERVAVAEKLRDTQARLSRATQIATVGELSASIAHEINQPLAAVVANGHACHRWLTASPPNIPRALLSLERIVRDGKGAADVIQRIRALYRHTALSKDALRVNEVIEEVCRFMETEARSKAVVLRARLAPSLPEILADRVQLQQVLSNLIRNAIEAMEPVTDRFKELCIVSLYENERVIVQVEDTGIGLEDTDNAFEAFFTTKPNGMGMGLAICRSIVEAHGGRMWAARATPCGTILAFSLPAPSLADPQGYVPQSAGGPSRHADGRR